MIPTHPVPARNRGVPSRPVNQMASRFSVPFPSRGKETEAFSHTVAPEDLCFTTPGGLNGYRPEPTGSSATAPTLAFSLIIL